jgi:hypothetical protein
MAQTTEEGIMTHKKGQPPDDVSSAPESGTVRDDTSGNKPSDRGYDPARHGPDHSALGSGRGKDDPSVASEER